MRISSGLLLLAPPISATRFSSGEKQRVAGAQTGTGNVRTKHLRAEQYEWRKL